MPFSILIKGLSEKHTCSQCLMCYILMYEYSLFEV